MTESHGKVWWSELNTRDVQGAKKYYARICGWQFETVPMEGGGDYVLAMQDGRPVAGFSSLDAQLGDDGDPPHWLTYLAVDDLDRAVRESVAAGARVMQPPFEVPGTGWIATIEDPTGAKIGFMTPEPMSS